MYNLKYLYRCFWFNDELDKESEEMICTVYVIYKFKCTRRQLSLFSNIFVSLMITESTSFLGELLVAINICVGRSGHQRKSCANYMKLQAYRYLLLLLFISRSVLLVYIVDSRLSIVANVATFVPDLRVFLPVYVLRIKKN